MTMMPNQRRKLSSFWRARAEKKRKQHAREKSADMGHVGAAALGAAGLRQLASSADKLQDDPAANRNEGRQMHDAGICEELHRAARKHQNICAENTGYGTRCPDIRQVRMR